MSAVRMTMLVAAIQRRAESPEISNMQGSSISHQKNGLTLAWVTDPHLNFLSPESLESFCGELAGQSVNGLVITGDIAEADTVVPILNKLDQALSFPIYFVLGNHDYYGGNIASIRTQVRQWAASSIRSSWMPAAGVIPLTERSALIGHGGWGDGQVGDFMGSNIGLNDYLMIEDLRGLPKPELLQSLKILGEEAARSLEENLSRSIETYEETILVTHVPPYLESCWYQGQATLNEWTPHFTCGAVGTMLSRLMAEHPEHTLRVYCGHTHNAGVAEIAPNITVYTGGAEYHSPALLEPMRIAG